jgi:hypothetical protein
MMHHHVATAVSDRGEVAPASLAVLISERAADQLLFSPRHHMYTRRTGIVNDSDSNNVNITASSKTNRSSSGDKYSVIAIKNVSSCGATRTEIANK